MRVSLTGAAGHDAIAASGAGVGSVCLMLVLD